MPEPMPERPSIVVSCCVLAWTYIERIHTTLFVVAPPTHDLRMVWRFLSSADGTTLLLLGILVVAARTYAHCPTRRSRRTHSRVSGQQMRHGITQKHESKPPIALRRRAPAASSRSAPNASQSTMRQGSRRRHVPRRRM